MQRALITIGIVCLTAGLAWPWLARWPWWRHLGRLPGDLYIEREGFSFYLPITTALIVSAAISLVLWLLRK